MAKYKFIKDKAEPSDETIRNKMNFGHVLQQTQGLQQLKKATQPAYKKPLLLGFIILLAVLTLVIILDEQEQTESTDPKNKKDSTLVEDSSKIKKP